MLLASTWRAIFGVSVAWDAANQDGELAISFFGISSELLATLGGALVDVHFLAGSPPEAGEAHVGFAADPVTFVASVEGPGQAPLITTGGCVATARPLGLFLPLIYD